MGAIPQLRGNGGATWQEVEVGEGWNTPEAESGLVLSGGCAGVGAGRPAPSLSLQEERPSTSR